MENFVDNSYPPLAQLYNFALYLFFLEKCHFDFHFDIIKLSLHLRIVARLTLVILNRTFVELVHYLFPEDFNCAKLINDGSPGLSLLLKQFLKTNIKQVFLNFGQVSVDVPVDVDLLVILFFLQNRDYLFDVPNLSIVEANAL